MATRSGHPTLCLDWPFHIVDRDERFRRYVTQIDAGGPIVGGRRLDFSALSWGELPADEQRRMWRNGRPAARRLRDQPLIYLEAVFDPLPRPDPDGDYEDTMELINHPSLNVLDRVLRRGAVVFEAVIPTRLKKRGEGEPFERTLNATDRGWMDHCGHILDQPTTG